MKVGARRARSPGWTWVFCQAALPVAQVEGFEVLEEEGEGLVGLAVRLLEGDEGVRLHEGDEEVLDGMGDWMGQGRTRWTGWAEQAVEGGRVEGRQERGPASQV